MPEQEKRLRAMCEYKGYQVYKVYEDAGISAKTIEKVVDNFLNRTRLIDTRTFTVRFYILKMYF